MAILDKFCPKCMNIIHRKDVKCSNCGMLVSDMIKQKNNKLEKEIKLEKETIKSRLEKETNRKDPKVVETKDGGVIVDTSGVFTHEEKKDAKEVNNKEDVLDDSVSSVEFEQQNKPKRHKHKSKSKKSDEPEYTLDEDGSYNIDTSDVTYLEKVTPSIKKARGDYEQEKLKWWEIYKWADRMLARRKIKKEVDKASTKTPEKVKRGAMIAWCGFFGWLGIHNFYGGNKKKGWTIVAFDVIVFIILNVPVLFEIMGFFVGGGLGFVVFALWFTDFFGLIFNKYKYKISKEEFISNLNVETRAKLSKKYISLDKVVFKAKEEKRLNKKSQKKIKKLEKQQKKNNIDKKEKRKKHKQETDYQIVTHKMD